MRRRASTRPRRRSPRAPVAAPRGCDPTPPAASPVPGRARFTPVFAGTPLDTCTQSVLNSLAPGPGDAGDGPRGERVSNWRRAAERRLVTLFVLVALGAIHGLPWLRNRAGREPQAAVRQAPGPPCPGARGTLMKWPRPS